MFPVLPLMTNDPQITRRVVATLPGIEIAQLQSREEVLEYLDIEMPDLMLIDFSAKSPDGMALLDSVREDPWLHHGGIISLCETYEHTERLEKIRDVNSIAILDHDELERDLPRVIAIIHENRRILFQHEINADFVEKLSASFKLHNDLLEVRCYSSLVCNFLFNSHKIDMDAKFGLNLVITELLVNAVEHGNCGIGYQEKTDFLEGGNFIEDLIKKKCADPLIAARAVTFEYTLTRDSAHFYIADEGEGFDWRNYRKDSLPENLFELHGRGIGMSLNMVGELTYNEQGNSVTFAFPFKRDIEVAAPGLFAEIDPREVAEDEIIFREGETNNFLYYIVKGQYDVVVNGTVVSSLGPDDVLMGEMSFLLNNRRSATVRARSPGKLIEISKKAFVDAIKRKPHYALFLSRLLAQRIQRLNSASSTRDLK